MNIKIDLVISANPELLNVLSALVGKGEPMQTSAPVAPGSLTNGEAKKTKAKKVYEVKVPEEFAQKEIIATELTQEVIIADAVPKSKAGHKDKIKAKVTELGYESITDLQPEHFDEFYAFLQTLPKP